MSDPLALALLIILLAARLMKPCCKPEPTPRKPMSNYDKRTLLPIYRAISERRKDQTMVDYYTRQINQAEKEYREGKATPKPPSVEAQLRHAAWDLRLARWFGGIFDADSVEAQLRHAAWDLWLARWFGGIFDAERIRADISRLEAKKEVRNAAIRQRILGNDPYASCPIANEAQATLARLEAEKEAYNAAIRKRILGN